MPQPGTAAHVEPARPRPHGTAPVKRLVLAGAGPWGRILLRTLSEIEGASLVAVATRQPDVAAMLPAGARRVDRWSDLFAMRPDGLIVATPAATHPTLALAAIALGVPALVEKPLAADVAAADAVRQAARAQEVAILVNHVDLANPAWRAVATAAGPAASGEQIEIVVGGPGPFRSDCSPLWDWGPHALALALDRLGLTAEVVAAKARPGQGAGAAGTIYAVELRRPDGARAHVSFGNGMPDKQRRALVRARSGTFTYDDRAAQRAMAETSDGRSAIEHPSIPPVAAALRRFVERLGPAEHGAVRPSDDLDLAVAVVARLAFVEASL